MVFDTSHYRFDTAQPSWWEESARGLETVSGSPLQSDAQCEVAIIGGGYTGLSAAYYLARDFGINTRVLEAGHIGWGASGRNGGFCCMGGTKLSYSKLIRKFGVDETRRYYQAQAKAVELVRAIAQDEAIDIEIQGESEIEVAETPAHFAALQEDYTLMRDTLGIDVRLISREAFRETGYDAPHQHGAIALMPGFGLNPLKFCIGLGQTAERHGAILHPHSEVTAWRKEDGKHLLTTENGSSIKADHVILACNGFMPEHLNAAIRGRAMPVPSQVIVTRVLTEGERAAHNWQLESPAINSRNVYGYYRLLPQGRFMFGSRTDFGAVPSGPDAHMKHLKDYGGDLWPEWRDIEIDYSWRGLVCFTKEFRPAVGRLEDDPTISYGFGYHGNGVNNATWIGKELAGWLATGNNKYETVPHHLPAILQGAGGKIPFAGLRKTYAQAGVAWHRFKDRLEGL